MEASIRAFMGVPLDDGGGCLCLDTKSRYAYQQKDTKILHQFGQLVTRIEGMSRLGDETDERHRFYAGLEAIHSLHQRQPKWSSYIRQFLDLLSAACGFDYCFLAARGERGEDYFIEEFNFAPCSKARDRAFPMSAGLVGWVFKNHRRLVNVDRDPGPPSASLFGPDVQNVPVRSLVCLPLRVHRTTRGVLVVADEQPRDVGENLLRFLDMAAGHLALLLENLYLKNRLTTQSGK
jgi:transcriptional regulator with GAF, ATPase, and Fis domain